MMLRAPLYAKILAWFFLNLLLLGAGFYLIARFQFHLSLDSLLAGRAGERIDWLGKSVQSALRLQPRTEWNDILARAAQDYGVKLYAFADDGIQAAGESVVLPVKVLKKIRSMRVRPALRARDGRPPFVPDGPPDDAPPPGVSRPPRPPGENAPTPPKFMIRAGDPVRYWVGIRIPLQAEAGRRPTPGVLLAVSDSLSGGGLFFDSTPWIVAGFGAVLVSLVFWAPFVRSITRDLGRLTHATERIAEGSFDVHPDVQRGDELGRLGQAIDQLGGQLGGFVTGQKRFLGDIAHELCSPLARMEMALGILDQQTEGAQRDYVTDAREEVRHMSNLVNELLSFSKAGLRASSPTLRPVPMRQLISDVIEREAPGGGVQMDAPPELQAMADPELLSRAVGNLIRNAARYAGQSGPIKVTASGFGERVSVVVADQGPGVPPETLARLGEPFYRPDFARSRETGGTGLGLAIVRTCIEACQGTVGFRNRPSGGLEAELRLPKAG
jgi:two-component system sensor histidine kinase CpxA